MLYKNIIKLTNHKGEQDVVTSYSSASIRISSTEQIKSASISVEFISNYEIMKNHTIGSSVEISNHPINEPKKVKTHFYGIITSVPKVLDGVKKSINFEAKCLLSKTQTIMVNEVYEGVNITSIIRSLMAYTNFYDRFEIPNIDLKANFSFKDEYLYDCLRKICEVLGDYTFESDLKTFRLFENTPKDHPIPIKKNMFVKGSAQFTEDESRLTNHIRCYGDKELTKEVKEEVLLANGTTTDFYVTYSPVNVEVYVDDVRRTVGTLYLHDSGYDCYVDYNQSLIQFTEPPAARKKVKIRYQYYQRVVIEESEGNSINKYGLRQTKMEQKHVSDRSLLRNYLRYYLSKFSEPLTVGSITPFEDKWDVNDRIHIDIPDLLLDKKLVCTEKTINLSPSQQQIQLSFDQKPNLVDVLKNHLERIRALEKGNGSEPEFVELFRTVSERVQFEDKVSLKVKDRSRAFILGQSKLGDVI